MTNQYHESKYACAITFEDGTGVATPLTSQTEDEAMEEAKHVLLAAALQGEFKDYGPVAKAGIIYADTMREHFERSASGETIH